MLDRRDDMTSSASSQQSQPQSQASEPAPAIAPVAPDEFEDDIPF